MLISENGPAALEHGFVQRGQESFAEMVALALGISLQEFRAQLAQGTIGAALIDRFRQVK
jgi:hypothetical protein